MKVKEKEKNTDNQNSWIDYLLSELNKGGKIKPV